MTHDKTIDVRFFFVFYFKFQRTTKITSNSKFAMANDFLCVSHSECHANQVLIRVNVTHTYTKYNTFFKMDFFINS